MRAVLTKLEDQVLSVLCSKCSCCLASTTHCWTCHSKIPIEKLCGCGDCKAKADDYLARVQNGNVRISNILKMKGLTE